MRELYTKLIYRYPVRKSIDKINKLIGISLDAWCQDPEIELADSTYIPELLSLLTKVDFDDDDNFYAMSLLFGCFEVAVIEGIDIDTYWNQTINELEKNIDLYATILAYWSCYDTENPGDPNQMFPITMKARQVWDRYKNNYQ